MALTTVPRWDKYDPYVGNFRGTLAADVDLATQANKVLAVGLNSDGAVTIGSGTSGIKGVVIIPVGKDMHGVLLDGGVNIEAGDLCDVGKHGEITSFSPTVLTYTQVITVDGTADGGTFTLTLGGKTTSALAYNITGANLKTALVALDDGHTSDDFTVTGNGPYSVTYNQAWGALTDDDALITVSATPTPDLVTITQPSTTAVAGTNYYGHADGSVTAVEGADGVYVGHTVEADRLIVNVLDATS